MRKACLSNVRIDSAFTLCTLAIALELQRKHL